MEEIQFTDVEKVAREYFHHLIMGFTIPCDTQYQENDTLPEWYDDSKYKRAQKYFSENRLGILDSNLCGLILLLAETKGLNILKTTNKSSTMETARKRYTSTILHLMSWYETDLVPNSKSWQSLNKVRKMHLSASNISTAHGGGFIAQSELALTTFGFMGFALIRPHMLGIKHDNKSDREAFVHFWAVISRMLGVADQFNMCLFPIDVVETICQLLLRYIFIPLLQIETPDFKYMVTTLLRGISSFIPHTKYEVQIFKLRRIAGIPGYQYNVDLSKEKIYRQIFTKDELMEAQNFLKQRQENTAWFILFTDEVPLIQINQKGDLITNLNNKLYLEEHNSALQKILGLGSSHQVDIIGLSDEVSWDKYLHCQEFYKLKKRDQFTAMWLTKLFTFYEYRIGRFVFESMLDVTFYLIRRWSIKV